MKTVAVIQSNYIPWKGYFDIIHDVDLFIFHDDLQYTKNDWRNRNRIKTPAGPAWLTIPVGSREDRLICEVGLKGRAWAERHWRLIDQNYSRAPYLRMYRENLREIFFDTSITTLSGLNQALIRYIAADVLHISTTFADSRDFSPKGRHVERLVGLLKKAGATHYVSGPTAMSYIDPVEFEKSGVTISFKDYGGYPEYTQPHPPFVHEVSILDLVFNTGPDAAYYIWGWRTDAKKNPPARRRCG